MEETGTPDEQLLKICLNRLITYGYIFNLSSCDEKHVIKLNSGAVITFETSVKKTQEKGN